MHRPLLCLFTLLLPLHCLASSTEPDNQLSWLDNAQGQFEITDVGALSDGGTLFMSVMLKPGKLIISRNSRNNPQWLTTYEGAQGETQRLALSHQRVEAWLVQWITRRYTCEQLANLHDTPSRDSVQDETTALVLSAEVGQFLPCATR
ncbi:hypothetical protein [Pseudomonas sp. 3A(2025)]